MASQLTLVIIAHVHDELKKNVNIIDVIIVFIIKFRMFDDVAVKNEINH